MSQTPIQRFIDLVAFDSHGIKLTKQLAELEAQRAQLEADKELLLKEIEDARAQVRELKKEVDAHELEMKELDAAEKDKKKRLDEVSDAKQFDAITKEIAEIKRRQHEFETTLLQAWNKLESATATLDQLVEASKTKVAQVQEKIDAKQAEIDELKNEHASYEKDRLQHLEGVPEDWLDVYATMRAKVSNPVVPVVSESCSACFYPITSQDLVALKRQKVMQCKNCYRFLYHELVQKAQA